MPEQPPPNAYELYRKNKMESGLLFQDFVVDVAWQTVGLAIVQYSSKAYQMAVGESRTGVEIKHDEKFDKSRNLWIEAGEKARPRPGDYFPSGIYRDDNTWLYVIGSYNTIFFFPKTLLRGLYESGRYRHLENNTFTSIGMLLPEADANKYAAVILNPHAAEKVKKITQDLKQVGEALHQLAKANPAQASLGFDASIIQDRDAA